MFKFYFDFHSIFIFIVSWPLWNDKSRTKSKYILLQFCHFTCWKQKNMQKSSCGPYLDGASYLHGQEFFKLLSFMEIWYWYFFIISLVWICNAISHDLITPLKNKNFTVTMICNQLFKNRSKFDSKKYKASSTDEK